MNKDHEQKKRILGRNIAYHRKLKGLSQQELAELLSISRTHMSNIEAMNSKTSISIDLLLNISDCLEVPVEKLLHFDI